MVWADLVVTPASAPPTPASSAARRSTLLHVLRRLLAAVLPDEQGRPPEPLRAGLEGPSAEELASWDELPPGDRAARGGGRAPLRRPRGRRAARAHDVAEPRSTCTAWWPGSRARSCPSAPRRCCPCGWPPTSAARRSRRRWSGRCATRCPEGAELELSLQGAEPSRFDPADPGAGGGAARAGARRAASRPVVVRKRRPDPDPGRRSPNAASRRWSAASRSRRPHPRARRELPAQSLELGLKAARALYEELVRSRRASAPAPSSREWRARPR